MALTLILSAGCGSTESSRLPHRVSFAVPHGPLAQLELMTPHQGWALTTSPAVLVTHDRHWQRVTPSQLPPNALMILLNGVTPESAWLAYGSGNPTSLVTLASTINAGRSWQIHSIRLPHPATLNQIDFVSQTTGYVVVALPGGGMGAFGEKVFVTTDGGRHWRQRPTPPIIGAQLSFLTSDRGWATGGQTGAGGVPNGTAMIDVTNDGGKQWQRQSLTLPKVAQPLELTVHPPHFWSSTDGFLWILGTSPTQLSTLILVYRTFDGGRQWTLEASKFWPAGALVGPVSAVGSQVWMVLNGPNSLVRFTAHHWQAYAFLAHHLEFMRFLNSQVGWAVSGSGTIWTTTTGGRTWNQP